MSPETRGSDICEFAALYALGALEGEDLWDFRSHLLDGCDACGADVDAYDATAALLAYAAPPARPDVSLRDRLMSRVSIGAEPAPLAAPRRGQASWEPYKIPGVSIRRLHVDEAAREAVMLVKAGPGVRYPMHRHAKAEEMFMLEGELTFGDVTYYAGDFIRSETDTIHTSSETRGGCMFLLRASLDNEVLY